MRLTEFNELVEGQFGPVRGASMLVDHVLSRFGRTPAQAIEDGECGPSIDDFLSPWAICRCSPSSRGALEIEVIDM